MIAISDRGRMWILDLDQTEPREIAQSANGQMPFWSPNSESIGYFTGRTLRKAPASGGPGTVVSTLPGFDSRAPFYSGTWNDAGEIVINWRGSDRLLKIDAGGGAPTVFMIPDSTKNEAVLAFPEFLPDGKSVIFSTRRQDGSYALMLLSGNDRHLIYEDPDGKAIMFPTYSSSGHILYQLPQAVGPPISRSLVLLPARSDIWAIPFSISSLNRTDGPFRVARNASQPSISDEGTLVYLSNEYETATQQVVWIDRQGSVVGRIGQAQERIDGSLEIAPDGHRVASRSRENGQIDIFIHDAIEMTKTRVTFDIDGESWPTWSPDGDHIAFSKYKNNDDIYVTDGTGEAQLLVNAPLAKFAPDWSPDGKYLIYHAIAPNTTNRDIWYIPLSSNRRPVPFAMAPYAETAPLFSPDGKLVVYTSDETDRWEVYVRKFPSGEGKRQISFNGGVSPRWNNDGRELFFIQNNEMMSVEIDRSSGVSLGEPQLLFSGDEINIQFMDQNYPFARTFDVSPDGQRFVAVQNIKDLEVMVVQNWYAEFSNRE